LDGIVIDIVGTQRQSDGKSVMWAFDVVGRMLSDTDYVTMTGAMKSHLLVRYPDIRVVLIMAGEVTDRALEIANNLGINIIRVGELQTKLTELLTGSLPISYSYSEPKGVTLRDTLSKIPLGTAGWFQYQKLCSNIFEYLFCPPLELPLFENPDANRRNRRDMIFPNNAEEGFWFNLRNTYDAHYIVVDAKNYARPLQKKPVLEIAHYLKPFGCGMFGILCSRKGPGPATIYAIQQEWISGRKMILALSDEDLTQMLELKISQGPAEEWLRNKISQFRMSF
jgi:hypothetical protein